MSSSGFPILIALILLVPFSLKADFQSAADAYRRNDYLTAFREFSELAESGDARAQTVLALMYKFGEGTHQDLEAAFRWYRRAALQGYAPAQYHAGVMLAEGTGTSVDREEAIRLLKLSAKAGFPRANDKLASLDSGMVSMDRPVDEYRAWSKNWDFKVPRPVGYDDNLVRDTAIPTYRVQLGAMSSRESAQFLWEILTREHPGLFRGYSLLVKASETTGKAIYRVQTGPFDSLEEARQFCEALNEAADQDCLPLQGKP